MINFTYDHGISIEANAATFAAIAHSEQKYGDAPYVVHLFAVRLVLADFGVVQESPLAVASLLHDTVEDTMATREQIGELFGPPVEALVWAVTGLGERRKLRVLNAYAKISEYGRRYTSDIEPAQAFAALKLKIADRIANVEASKRGSNHRKMYQSEQPGFEGLIWGMNGHMDPVVDRMLARLRVALIA